MARDANGRAHALNAFALVSYLPDPLAGFLDDLRRALIPTCIPHAHVTILPPRPVTGRLADAAALLRPVLEGLAPFEAEAGDLAVFPATGVIYLELSKGRRKFLELHEALNRGVLEYQEPYLYHPHVTLAQEIPPGLEAEILGRAREIWKSWGHSKRFRVEAATFVESTLANVWVDLEDYRFLARGVRR